MARYLLRAELHFTDLRYANLSGAKLRDEDLLRPLVAGDEVTEEQINALRNRPKSLMSGPIASPSGAPLLGR